MQYSIELYIYMGKSVCVCAGSIPERHYIRVYTIYYTAVAFISRIKVVVVGLIRDGIIR